MRICSADVEGAEQRLRHFICDEFHKFLDEGKSKSAFRRADFVESVYKV